MRQTDENRLLLFKIKIFLSLRSVSPTKWQAQFSLKIKITLSYLRGGTAFSVYVCVDCIVFVTQLVLFQILRDIRHGLMNMGRDGVRGPFGGIV